VLDPEATKHAKDSTLLAEAGPIQITNATFSAFQAGAITLR
jgi:hypothetical protein